VNLTAEVRLHLGESKSALLRYTESADALSLDIVIVPREFRSQGLGSLLVRRVLLLADSLGKPVLTTARPIGGHTPETLERLVSYYGQFGFRTVQRGVSAVHMRRPAGGLPPPREPEQDRGLPG
jgi:GNAT superfamily N-acetyltransferase